MIEIADVTGARDHDERAAPDRLLELLRDDGWSALVPLAPAVLRQPSRLVALDDLVTADPSQKRRRFICELRSTISATGFPTASSAAYP